MPDFSKMFAKRLEEDTYKSLVAFFTGKVTYADLPKDSQRVLNGLEKPDETRTFTEQEQLYELKQKLVLQKLIKPDSDAFDRVEQAYRTFIAGEAVKRKPFPSIEHVLRPVDSDYQKIKAFYAGNVSFAQLNTLQRSMVDAVFRKEMSEDPDVHVLRSMLQTTKKKGKKRPGRPDYLVDDDGDTGVGGVKVAGYKGTKPLISKTQITTAKEFEIEMQELRPPLLSDAVPITVERYVDNTRVRPFKTRSGPLVIEIDDMSAEPLMRELTQLDATFEWAEISGRSMLKVGTHWIVMDFIFCTIQQRDEGSER